jgi:hypothetical protein
VEKRNYLPLKQASAVFIRSLRKATCKDSNIYGFSRRFRAIGKHGNIAKAEKCKDGKDVANHVLPV